MLAPLDWVWLVSFISLPPRNLTSLVTIATFPTVRLADPAHQQTHAALQECPAGVLVCLGALCLAMFLYVATLVTALAPSQRPVQLCGGHASCLPTVRTYL